MYSNVGIYLKKMKLFVVFLVLVIAMTSMGEVTTEQIQCTSSSECSTKYCRFGVCTSWGENEGEEGRENPCNLTDCESGTSCVIMQVSCLVAPCPGASYCLKDSSP